MSIVEKKKKKKRKIVVDEDEKFLETIQTETPELFTFKKNVLFFLVALLTSFVPSYLFQSIVDLRFEGLALWILFGLVVLFSTRQLFFGYKNLYEKNRKELTIHYGKKVEDVKIPETEKEKLIEYASLGYTFWSANSLYVLLVLGIGFYFLKEWDPRMNYAVSLFGSGYLTNILVSRERTVRKKRRKRLFR